MAEIEELEARIEDLRAQLAAVARGHELKTTGKGFRLGTMRVYEDVAGILRSTGKITCHYGTAAERAASTDYKEGVFWWESDNDELFVGTSAGWQDVGGASVGGAHNFLSATSHIDTVTQGATRGSFVVGNATPKWDEFTKGSSGDLLRMADANDPGWEAPGISDTNIVKVDGSPSDNEYSKFTASGLEGRTYANVRTDINVADGADVTGDNAPKAHTASHKHGGADEVATATPGANVIPKAGADSKLAAGFLQEVLAYADLTDDPYADHSARHENTGADEISVAGLSGLLADDQHVLDAEAIAAVEGEATLDLTGDVTIAAAKTLAVDAIIEKTGAAGVTLDVKGLIKDGLIYPDKNYLASYFYVSNLVAALGFDTDDNLTFTKATNQWGLTIAAGTKLGVDASNVTAYVPLKTDDVVERTADAGVTLDGVTLKDDAVEVDALRGLKESGGQALDMGAVADGEYLKRSGTDIVGAAGGGGQDLATDTLWAAAGDLAKGTGDDTADILSAGASGTFLRIDGSIPYWDAPGIADTNPVIVDATDGAPNDDEYARWTASGLEGRTEAQFKSDFNLEDADINTLAVAAVATADDYLKNDASDSTSGDLTAVTFLATGDTSAGDNSALGYTAAEGAILAGQGSTSDVTIKNDADGTVISIPTGTTVTKLASEICMIERADHESAPGAGFGYLWTKNTAPSTLIFTDDAGTDTTLGAGGGGGGDSIWDADTDTGIQTEEGADEDVIRFDVGGAEKVVFTSTVAAHQMPVGAYCTPANGIWLDVSPPSLSLSASAYGIRVQPSSLSITANNVGLIALGGLANAYGGDGLTGQFSRGFDFRAGAYNTTAGRTTTFSYVQGATPSLAGIAVGSGTTTNITQADGLRLGPPSFQALGGGTLAVTDCHGINMSNYGSTKVTNGYGLKIDDISNCTTINRILELGPTPYLRLEGSDDYPGGAADTPLLLAWGATPTLARVKVWSHDGHNVLELVNV